MKPKQSPAQRSVPADAQKTNSYQLSLWKCAASVVAVALMVFSARGAGGAGEAAGTPVVAAPVGGTPVKVEVRKTADGKWELLRGGKPYFVKGGGGDYSREVLVGDGGNSIRLWGVDASTRKEVDEDAKQGVTVVLGYWVGHKADGFKADDPAAVKQQLEDFKQVVRTYRNDPAVLVWGIGNEMETRNDTPALWASIEDLAKAAHELDPNHPTMTVIAEVGGSKVANLHKYCPDIDIVGINSYAGGQNVGDRYLKQVPGGTAKPYIITEFGPPGQWEYWSRTAFKALNEMTSTEKATWYSNSYQKTVLGHPGECLGSYAFLWGNKVEATITWYGMFLPDGSKLAAADTMQEFWSGKAPKYLCPVIKKLAINGSNEVIAGATVNAGVDASDPQGDNLKYEWVMYRELGTYNIQEQGAGAGQVFTEAIVHNGEPQVSVKMPGINGVYRIYCYVRNEHGAAATGSLPVLVKGGREPSFKAPLAKLPYLIYGEEQGNTYVASGYTDNTNAVAMDEHCADNPHSGKTCIKAMYKESIGKGGVVWQSPANDWGDKPGGFDFTGARKLTFWACGDKGGEKATFGFGYLTKDTAKDKKYLDSDNGILNVTLTPDWQFYTIYVSDKNLKLIKSGFFWSVEANGAPVTLYLSTIKWE
jgi:hypothetical protein